MEESGHGYALEAGASIIIRLFTVSYIQNEHELLLLIKRQQKLINFAASPTPGGKNLRETS